MLANVVGPGQTRAFSRPLRSVGFKEHRLNRTTVKSCEGKLVVGKPPWLKTILGSPMVRIQLVLLQHLKQSCACCVADDRIVGSDNMARFSTTRLHGDRTTILA